jgi:tetratricopeptide (TPR) repeat protein
MLVRVDEVCDRFEAAWKEGGRPRIEDYLGAAGGAERIALLRELLRVELAYRYGCGQSPTPEEYYGRFSGHCELIDSGFASVCEGGADRKQLGSTALERTDPTTADAVPVRAGRFRIEELIDKGGMGEIFRVRDDQLNRALAVKVLTAQYRDSPERIARFLLEAQLTGQLQHPGIPPIHELGELDDGRPFFAMKLIEGQTLAKLLDGRENVAASLQLADEERQVGNLPPRPDLPYWLGVFEHICQAVSYAHSERVIHRDLKPRNVMVGRFGEVQVMDWGLAKRMAVHSSAGPFPGEREQDPLAPRSHPGCGPGIESSNGLTGTGQMLGTPAYMPPEQANGAWEQADERVDVFALGSILCEILTGKPAYVGGSWEEVFQKAQRGDLADAFARLDGCGADAELLYLARRCLAPDKADRPRHALELAATITLYLAGVQERLRAAEVEQAAAQARSEEAAKKAAAELRAAESERDAAQARAEKAAAQAAAERRARRLMMVLAAAVLVAVGLGTAGGVYRQQQRQRAREQAAVGLDQLAALRDSYRFDDARTMLEQVRGWANQAADSELHARLLQTESELELARDLDNVRQNAATLVDGKWDPGRAREEYPEVLARHGLDVLEGELDELAELIWTSAVRDSIIAALDDWARVEIDRQRKLRLLMLANRADEPDQWRQAVRQALVSKDEKRIRQLVGETKNGKPTPGIVLLLASFFRKESEAPTVLLRRVQLERPGDFWINFTLGSRLSAQEKHQEAAECCRVAVAVRPDSAPAHNNFGNALAAKGQVDDAIAEYREAIRLKKDYPKAHYNLGIALQANGQLDDAIAEYREAIRLKKDYPEAHYNLGIALQAKGQVDDAIAEYREALWLKKDYPEAHYNLGIALQAKGQVDDAIAEYREAIRLKPDAPAAHVNLGNVLDDKGQVDEAIACYRKAIQLDPENANAHTNLGGALKAKGKVEEAIKCHRRAIEINPKHVNAHNRLGNALHAKGKLDDAIACFQKAIALDPQFAPAHINLGFALRAKGNLDEAIAWYHKAIRLDPKRPVAHSNLGLALRTKGQLDEAIACFQKAIQLDRKHAMAHYGLGDALREKGKLDEAIAWYQRAIDIDPRFAEAHCNLGHVLRWKGEYAAALAALRRGHELGTQKREWQYPSGQWVNQCQRLVDLERRLPAVLKGTDKPASIAEQIEFAQMCVLKKFHAEAARTAAELARVPPGNWEHSCRAADLLIDCVRLAENDRHLSQSQRQAAVQAYVQQVSEVYQGISKRCPKDRNVLFALAWGRAQYPDPRFRHPSEALALAQRAVQLVPEDGDCRLVAGMAHYRVGNWKEALDALEKAMPLRKGGDCADWFFLAMTHWQRGDKARARQWYDKGARWLIDHHHDEWPPMRAEAANLLGLAHLAPVRTIPYLADGNWTGNVIDLASAADGCHILASEDGRELRLYEVATGKEARRFTGHTHWVYAVALSPDGRRALSGGADRTLRLWDVDSGKELCRFVGHPTAIRFVAFSPDGRQALSGGNDENRDDLAIHLWDLATGKEVCRLTGHTGKIHHAAFSPDGARILSASADRTSRLWDVQTGEQIRQFQDPGTATCISFSPDGTKALSAGPDDPAPRLWDVGTGKLLRRLEGFKDKKEPPRWVIFTPDGRRALSAHHGEARLRLWDVATGEELYSVRLEPGLRPNRLVVAADGGWVASCNLRGSVSVWQLVDPKPTR